VVGHALQSPPPLSQEAEGNNGEAAIAKSGRHAEQHRFASAASEFALLVDLGDHVAQGRVGDPHKADQRGIQLKDKKDRTCDRE
jgi:hypothetical protein